MTSRIETRRLSLPTWLRRVPNFATEQHTIHAAAVVGSIIFLTSVIFVAGKPLISACFQARIKPLDPLGGLCQRAMEAAPERKTARRRRHRQHLSA